MPTIVRDGITLAYEERGNGSPAFVFVHGWTCNRSFFAPQAEHFAPRHRVVSVDLRGHGDSDKPQGAYPISAYADDLAFLIDKLSLGRVIAVGHSMGGITVLQLARRLSREGGRHRHGGSRSAGFPARPQGRHRGPGGRHRGRQSGAAPAVHRRAPLPPDLGPDARG